MVLPPSAALPLPPTAQDGTSPDHFLPNENGATWTLPAAANNATLGYDLDALKVRPHYYDEIRIRFRPRHSLVLFQLKLDGYPARDQHRSWYSKIHIEPGKWQAARFDLRCDDDGWWKGREENDGSALRITMAKRFLRTPGEPAERVVDIESIQFIRYEVSVVFDEFDATLVDDKRGITWRYPLTVRNHTTRPLKARIDLVKSTYNNFIPSWTEQVVSLAPREEKTLSVAMSMDAEKATALPALSSERALLRIQEVGKKDAAEMSPLIGYRPRYLYATVPPKGKIGYGKPPEGKAREDVLAAASKLLGENAAVPIHGPGLHPQSYLDPETNGKLDAISWFRHRSKKTGKVLTDEKLTLSYIQSIHSANFKRADTLAQAWQASGDLRYAVAARDVFLEYARWYHSLPMTSAASTSGRTRLGQSTLMTCFWIESAWSAYARIRESAALSSADRRRIEEEFILPELRAIYGHNVEYSNMQVHHFETYTRGVVALGKHWNLFGDALYGDHGFNAIIERTFTADGMAHEGGVYHWFTLKPLLAFTRSMAEFGVNVMTPRFKRVFDGGIENTPDGIIRSRALAGCYVDAYAAYKDPSYLPTLAYHSLLPEGTTAPKAAPLLTTSSVQKNNGYLWLRESSGAGLRALSINYLMQWDRLEHDRLHFTLYDPDPVTGETGRITYGSKQAGAMEKTAGHNSFVVDGEDSRDVPSTLAAFLDRPKLPAALITEGPDSSVYEGVRYARAVAIIDGIWVVADVIEGAEGKSHRYDFPLYTPWEPWSHKETGVAAIPLDLTPYEQLGYTLMTKAESAVLPAGTRVTIALPSFNRKTFRADQNPPVKNLIALYAPGAESRMIRARTPRGHRPEPGPVLCLRQEGRTARNAVAFDAVGAGVASRLKGLKVLPLPTSIKNANLCGAWELSTDTGVYHLLINRSGAPISLGGVTTAGLLSVDKVR